MKSIILVLAFLAVASCSSPGLCAATKAGVSFFYLCPFAQGVSFEAEDSFLNLVNFSIINPQVLSCNGTTDVFGTVSGVADNCTEIAYDNPVYTLINDTDPNQGLNITYQGVPTGNNTNVTLTIMLTCDVDLDDVAGTNFTYNGPTIPNLFDNQTFIVTGASKYGCPVISFNNIIDFLYNNRVIFSVVLGVIGFILTFFGLKLFNFAVFVIAALAGTLFSASLLFEFISLGAASWVPWAVFIGSLALGILLGVVALKLEKVGFFCVGAALGVVGGLMLYNAIILPIMKSGSGSTTFYISLVVCAIIGGIIAFFIFETVLILATSLVGSYLLIRVISIYTGNFPNEAYIVEGLKSFDFYTYIYLAGIVILAIVGAVIQFKTKAAKREDEEEPQGGRVYAYYRN